MELTATDTPAQARGVAPGRRDLVRAALWLTFLGGTVGPALDGLHTFSGATWYPHPQLLRSVWWCPPLFAFAGLSIGLGRLLWERVLERPGPRQSWSAVLSVMGLFVVTYAASGFLPISEVARTVVLLAAFAVAWGVWDRTALGVASALTTGPGGWLVEHTLVGKGLFFHRETTLDGIALWLPCLYFTAAIAVGALARKIAEPRP